MKFLAAIGAAAIAQVRKVCYIAAIVAAVVLAAVRPRYWPRTTRDVLARQVLFTGIEAISFISILAVPLSVSIVVQVNLWITKLGQSRLLGPVLVTVVIRELGPLLTNFVVIGRSGTAMAGEMGQMKVSGQIRILDAQGLDPFTYLVLPRVLGMVISVFCLTVLFCGVTLVSGYFLGVLLGAPLGPAGLYFEGIVGSISLSDVGGVLAKTIVPALMTGAICCAEGLSVGNTISEVPMATTRALQRSVIALFVLSALVSLATYL
jgi:phospholipid/cholesterol/gamma-HCH transport system permease protein